MVTERDKSLAAFFTIKGSILQRTEPSLFDLDLLISRVSSGDKHLNRFTVLKPILDIFL